uniref:HNH nuclease domain-containing protein n=1 Tax=viral metagenome TaxID=1070528 RepID=A0A6C0BHH3_9ZZZZ
MYHVTEESLPPPRFTVSPSFKTKDDLRSIIVKFNDDDQIRNYQKVVSIMQNMPPSVIPKKTHKTTIPKSLREQVWLRYNGHSFIHKCHITWCTNNVTPFDFEVGHNIPESKGGTTEIHNLRPICSRCNKSMGNHFTITEYSALSETQVPQYGCFFNIFTRRSLQKIRPKN